MSVSSGTIRLPGQGIQRPKDAGEDAESAQLPVCLGPSLAVMSALLPPHPHPHPQDIIAAGTMFIPQLHVELRLRLGAR